MRQIFVCAAVLLVGWAVGAQQRPTTSSDEGWILGLEKAWNHALEQKDGKALDQVLAKRFVSIDIDGSVQNKSEFLAGIEAPDYKPSQAVTEESSVQVYGNAAVVVGILRTKGVEKGKAFVRRERFADTWVKIDGTWQCVATTSTLIAGK